MERPTIVMIKNINNGHHHLSPQQQQSMDHQPYIPFVPPKPPLRNASFSSYLFRPNHQDIHVNTSHCQADDSEICIFDARKYFNETNNNINIDSKVIITNNNNRVSPLNVVINNNNNNSLGLVSEHRISGDVPALPRFSSSSSVDGYGRNYGARSFNATPTASSEASWNSQTGLLQNTPGAVAISMRNPATEEKRRGGRTSSKWQLLGRNCPCSGKKSVRVEEKASSSSSVVSVSAEPETPAPAARLYNNSNNHKRQIQKSLEVPVDKSFQSEEVIANIRRISAENRFTGLGQQRLNIVAPGRPYTDATPGFTFPILNQTSSMKLALNNAPLLEDPPRESLEIFQPPSDQETAVSRNSTRRSFTFPASPGRTRMTTDDDVASDASSDLFEIESFSTQTTTYPMYHRRDSLDEAASFNARRLAAASGNNNLMYYCTRGSPDEPATPSIAATECYEPSEASIDWSVTTAEGWFDRGSVITNYSVAASEVDDVAATGGGGGGGSGRKKGNGGMLLSCRCEKAVSVVGPNPVKCVAGSGMRHVSSRTCNVNNNNNSKPPLARSQPHTLSLPFATYPAT